MAIIIDLFTKKNKKNDFGGIEPYREGKVKIGNRVITKENLVAFIVSIVVAVSIVLLIIKYFYIPIAQYFKNETLVKSINIEKTVIGEDQLLYGDFVETNVSKRNIDNYKNTKQRPQERITDSGIEVIRSWKDENGAMHYSNR